MKFIEDLIYTQYYELKKKDRPIKSAKTTALVLVSVLGVLVITAVFMIFYASGIAKGIANPMGGRAMGKILALLAFGLVYAIVYGLFGRESKYNEIISSRELISEQEQENMYKSGMKNMAILFLLLMGIIIICGMIA